jgi:hypothetical protein
LLAVAEVLVQTLMLLMEEEHLAVVVVAVFYMELL